MLIDKNILGQEALNVLLSLNVFHSSPRLFQPLASVLEFQDQWKIKERSGEKKIQISTTMKSFFWLFRPYNSYVYYSYFKNQILLNS